MRSHGRVSSFWPSPSPSSFLGFSPGWSGWLWGVGLRVGGDFLTPPSFSDKPRTQRADHNIVVFGIQRVCSSTFVCSMPQREAVPWFESVIIRPSTFQKGQISSAPNDLSAQLLNQVSECDQG